MARTIDLSNVGGSNVLLEEGTYLFTIKNVKEGVTQAGDDKYLVTFEEAETGAVVFENYVLKENCLWKLKELLDACGFDTSSAIDFDPNDLKGIMVKGKVIQDTYEGNTSNKMKKVYSA